MKKEVEAIIRQERRTQNASFLADKHNVKTNATSHLSKSKETAKKLKLEEAKVAAMNLSTQSVADSKVAIEKLEDLRNTKIADISFAYRNQDLLTLLR